jgi:chaperonin GroEL (HSP60 family)
MEVATIQKRIDELEKLEEEVRVAREMLKGELENEEDYNEAADVVKEATAKRKTIKDQILARGPNQKILTEIKENQEEITTLKEILSAELMEFYNQNQTDEFADRKFKVLVRLLPKKGNYEKHNG